MKSAFTLWHHLRVCHYPSVGCEVQSRCQAGRQPIQTPQQEGRRWSIAAAADGILNHSCSILPFPHLPGVAWAHHATCTKWGPMQGNGCKWPHQQPHRSGRNGEGRESWGPLWQQQCWQRVKGRDSKALPKNIEQFHSSEAASTENCKRLDHPWQLKSFCNLSNFDWSHPGQSRLNSLKHRL